MMPLRQRHREKGRGRLSVLVAAALVAIASGMSPVAAVQTDLTGNWIITITSPQGTNDVNAKVKQEGERITGAVVTTLGELPFEGTLVGSDVKITWNFALAGQSLAVVMIGKIEEASLKGTVDFGGIGEGQWTAKRAPLADLAPATSPTAPSRGPATDPPANVAGRWSLTIETLGGPLSVGAQIIQDGEKVTGTVAAPMGEVPLAGSIQGRSLTFKFSIDVAGLPLPIAISADLEGDSLQGTADFGVGQGKFTAHREKGG